MGAVRRRRDVSETGELYGKIRGLGWFPSAMDEARVEVRMQVVLAEDVLGAEYGSGRDVGRLDRRRHGKITQGRWWWC